MYMDFAEAILLIFVIMACIYLVHTSNLRVIREKVKGEVENKRLTDVNSKLTSILESMRELNYSIELTAEEQRSKRVMCFQDGSKECDVCQGDCPYRKGGEWRL